jgi:thiol-disulfide isomerase/thioredoxin
VFRLDSIADEYKKASAFLLLIQSKTLGSENAAGLVKTNIRTDIFSTPDNRKLEIENVGAFWSHTYLSYLIHRDADTIPDFFKRYGYYLTALKKIDSLYSNPLKDYAKASVIYGLLFDASDYRPGKDSLIRLSRNFLQKADIPVRTKKHISDQTDLLASKTTSLGNNTIAPSFSATNLKGQSLNLRAYGDTILFIDVWASWCLPCIGQFPSINKLVDKYDGKKLKFIMISVDESEEHWRKAVKKYNLKTKQYHSSNGFNGEFAKKYFINSLPRYLILHNERVVNANSLSPGNADLKIALDSLLD